MKKLSIEEALKLCRLIGEFIPSRLNNDLEFIGTIVGNIRRSGKSRNYVEALSILTEFSVEEIVKNLPPEDGLGLFYEGLYINQIVDLKNFYDGLKDYG